MTTLEPELVKSIKNRLDVAFLPTLVQPETLADRTVIVTDVLRATTTIIHSLFNGCQQVLPRPSIESARQAHLQIENSVLGGERGGKIVNGFHNGNSPLEYTAEVIEGKSLILATTNGTVAMEHCRAANRVLIGSMINLSAVANLIEADEKVTIVCSGTDGFVTSEDVIFAGALIERIVADLSGQSNGAAGQNGAVFQNSTILQNVEVARNGSGLLSDMASIAVNHWQNTCRAVGQGAELADFFRTARGGINLVKIGHDEDIVFASQIDTVPVVPELDVESWSIRLNSNRECETRSGE